MLLISCWYMEYHCS